MDKEVVDMEGQEPMLEMRIADIKRTRNMCKKMQTLKNLSTCTGMVLSIDETKKLG